MGRAHIVQAIVDKVVVRVAPRADRRLGRRVEFALGLAGAGESCDVQISDRIVAVHDALHELIELEQGENTQGVLREHRDVPACTRSSVRTRALFCGRCGAGAQ